MKAQVIAIWTDRIDGLTRMSVKRGYTDVKYYTPSHKATMALISKLYYEQYEGRCNIRPNLAAVGFVADIIPQKEA